MSLRFHEIAESNHQILNPFTPAQLELLGEICAPDNGTRQLDLCCGKGEMLCQWAARYGLMGVGVDISAVFLEAAAQRARALEVGERIHFTQGDAADYPEAHHQFDIVSCIGATWIGGGLSGTLELMKPALKDDRSLLLVGEPYWIEPAPDEAYTLLTDGEREMFLDLEGTLGRFEAAGLELIEMVLANPDGWDRYVARQWKNVSDYLRAHPNDPDADELQAWVDLGRLAYLKYGRRYFGWGVFVLRQR
ncbi:MAG: methyltransferase domain-containing protein [Anaerolineae bacterium]|nr:methyltransferase domain-containing protein [Anaerolineae bacterium]